MATKKKMEKLYVRNRINKPRPAIRSFTNLSRSLLWKNRSLRRNSDMAARPEGETEKLYVLMYHADAGPYVHSLYALDIPGESTPSLPPPATGPFADLDAADNDPGRKSVKPILYFPRERFPRRMGCVRFDSKLYFMGGIIGFDEETAYYTPDVYILDLKKTTTITRLATLAPERTWEVLDNGPPMSTGKFSPVAFEFGGRIFVLSGHDECPDTGVDLTPCEVFTPAGGGGSGGTWAAVDPPPFESTLYNYVVVRDRVLICNQNKDHYWFNPNAKSDNFCGPVKGFVYDLAESSLFVGDDTFYCCFNARGVVTQKYSGPSLFEDMGDLEVIKSKIISKRPTSVLVNMRGSKRRFCFLQAASPCVLDPDRLSVTDSPFTGHFNLTVFEAEPGRDPKFLYWAHYSTKIDKCDFIATHAHIVVPC